MQKRRNYIYIYTLTLHISMARLNFLTINCRIKDKNLDQL